MCCRSGWEKGEEMGRRSRDAEFAALKTELASAKNHALDQYGRAQQAQAREMALREAIAEVSGALGKHQQGEESYSHRAMIERLDSVLLASPTAGWPEEVKALRDFARSALLTLKARGEQRELINGLDDALAPFEGVE